MRQKNSGAQKNNTFMAFFLNLYMLKFNKKNGNQAPGGLYVSTQILLTEAYFYEKIAFYHQNFELFVSGLVSGHFPLFWEFGQENKLALKFNFTW